MCITFSYSKYSHFKRMKEKIYTYIHWLTLYQLIGICIYFRCYSYKFMKKVPVSRLKLKDFKLWLIQPAWQMKTQNATKVFIGWNVLNSSRISPAIWRYFQNLVKIKPKGTLWMTPIYSKELISLIILSNSPEK